MRGSSPAAMRTIYCVLFLSFLTAVTSRVQTVDGRLKVQIGGTAGCPHVARYIRESVTPVFAKYGRFLDIEFVPWGKTRRVEGRLECQFGATDCWANRLHRCALDFLKSNQTAAMSYLNCEFTEPRPGFTGSYHCAVRAGLRLVDVDNCMATSKGDALELPAEAAAAEPIATFNSIPYTVINGLIDRAVTQQSSRRLESVICFALADDPTTGVVACKI
ncbi:GILT-like protein 1 [Pieris rapae]|uniref:GILT-like protein 1 n=1 Tax=Pieris rapae TaxID=64459 RepID=UPI001E2817B5|nr:GILT-like protein 1 [Pieris rapae]